jgi:porin
VGAEPIRARAWLILVVLVAAQAHAAEPAAASPPQGIVPIPDYSGDIWSRSYLSGDWRGERNHLADMGLQFDLQFIQFLQSSVGGGFDADTETRWLGRFTYKMRIDLMRMGILPGAVINVRAESRFGRTVNADAGAVLPVNTASIYPVKYSDLENDQSLAITNLSWLQMLSEHFGLIAGKIDMFDGDPNEFAGGRGDTQFMNWNFNYAAPVVINPGSTLGAGAVVLPHENWILQSLVVSASDSSSTNGFTELDEGGGGVLVNGSSLQYRLFDLPGGFNATYLYYFDKDFTNLNSFAVQSRGIDTSRKHQSWTFFVSAWQYLYTEQAPDGPLDLNNQVPDLEGVGLFTRFSFADKTTNPWKNHVSGGIGGRGVVPTRDNDVFGIGYFYNWLETARLDTRLGEIDLIDVDSNEWGFEFFYNIAITPAAKLSFDIQVVDSPLPGVSTGTVIGGRFGMTF